MSLTAPQVRLVELLRNARCAVVLTGAGVSTGSGIPDFRSPGGLWSQVDPERVVSLRGFHEDPEGFWAFYRQTWATLHDHQPNVAHVALAALQDAGVIAAVITQNIDGLHQKAGSREVVEVHGTTATCSCLGCGRRWRWREIAALAAGLDGHVRCRDCAKQIKPDVTLFGEGLAERAWAAARGWVKRCDVLLCVGSSLSVKPVSNLPKRVAHHPHKTLVIANAEPTPYTSQANIVLAGDCALTLPPVAAAVRGSDPVGGGAGG